MLCNDLEQDLKNAGITNISVDLEIVGGNTRPTIVQNLIGYFDRRGYLSYLIVAVRRARLRILF